MSRNVGLILILILGSVIPFSFPLPLISEGGNVAEFPKLVRPIQGMNSLRVPSLGDRKSDEKMEDSHDVRNDSNGGGVGRNFMFPLPVMIMTNFCNVSSYFSDTTTTRVAIVPLCALFMAPFYQNGSGTVV